MPLSSQLCIPVAFRLLAFASWTFLHPLRNSAFLTVGLLSLFVSDLVGVIMFRSLELRLVWVPSLLRGLGVHLINSEALINDQDTLRILVLLTQYCRVFPLVPATLHNGASLKVRLRSPVQSSSCPVFSRRLGINLRLCSWLRTSPLLVTHAGVED
jgi:hypothetical protein